MNDIKNSKEYTTFLNEIKSDVIKATKRWVLNNKGDQELIPLFWRIGKKLLDKADPKWDSSYLLYLSEDLTFCFPHLKTFQVESLRKMKMLAGYFTEEELEAKWLAELPWEHWKRLLNASTDKKEISLSAYQSSKNK